MSKHPKETPSPLMIHLFEDAARVLAATRHAESGVDRQSFEKKVDELILDFRTATRSAGYPPDAIDDAVFAFVAALDEAVLSSGMAFRSQWEARSLQLKLYGDQLAGEKFFERLSAVRERGAPYGDVVEVFHACLALGFEGKFALRTDESLRHMRQTIGIDISRRRPTHGAYATRSGRAHSGFLRRRRAPATWIAGAVLGCGLVVAGVSARMGFRSHPLSPSQSVALAPPVTESWIKITVP